MRLDQQGNLQVVDGLEDVRQRVIAGLQFFLAEWFLSTDLGVPYFQSIFTRPVTAALASTVIAAQIRSKPGVTGVGNIQATIDPNTRVFSMSVAIHTPFGSTVIGMSQQILN